MSGARRLYLDEAPGETRGVVMLDGQPERLLIARVGETSLEAGARLVVRVRRIERGLGSAFVDMGDGPDGILALTGAGASVVEGQALEVEITAPARRGKGPQVRLIGGGEGSPRLLYGGPDLVQRLQAFAPEDGFGRGEGAREAAELAEEAVLATVHPLGGGADLSVEPTRALVAIDVDVGAATGRDRRRSEDQINRRAIAAGARLLRLKGLGGLVVFDLAGRGQDGEAALAAAKAAFAPDQPGVVFGPVTRLGTLQLALPWRARPLAEQLLAPDGRPSAGTVAARLARGIETEAARTVRVRATCAPEVAAAASAFRPALVERLGPRFDIQADPALPRERFEIRAL